MAEPNSTPPLAGLEYKHLLWGELIYGTKEQLQYIGLGVGKAFPGEADGPRRKMTVPDPRGLTAEITQSCKEKEIFCASIRFPGRDIPEEKWIPFAFGVHKNEHIRFDEFFGTEEALCAAGLVQAHQFPGRPGMRKTRVIIHPDGCVATGAPTANDRKARLPGAKRIQKEGKSRYSVQVCIPEEIEELRVQVYRAKHDAWEKRMATLPRPKPLCGSSPIQPQTSHRVQTLAEFRTCCRRWINIAASLIYEGVEENGFILPSESIMLAPIEY